MLRIRFHEEKGNTHQRSFIKIAEIIEQFVDQFRHSKEEKTATFLKQEARVLIQRRNQKICDRAGIR
jgi:hemerythrin-like domain-containing protein